MSYDVTRGGRLRFGKFGGALLAASFLAGCNEDPNSADGGDAGDAGTGFVSASPRGDDAGGNIDTQGLSVGFDTSQAPDNLSVGLDSIADAGITESSAPATSGPGEETTVAAPSSSEGVTSAPATSEPGEETTVVAPSSNEGLTSALTTSEPGEETTVVAPSSNEGVTSALTTSSEGASSTAVATSDVQGSSSEVASSTNVDTSAPPQDTSEIVSSSDGESSTAAPVELFAEIEAVATWADLPATFRAVELPAADHTLTWSVKSVPWESEVSDLDLSDLVASQVSFVPDVAGLYTLNLRVASGEDSIDVEASVNVAMVDVAFLKVTNGPDGGYVYEPKMVPSDGTLEPVDVGCSFDTWEWDPRDYTNWRNALLDESRTIGFRYPNVPGGETLFAYHYRADNDAGVTQVATVHSDCVNNPPIDLDVGFQPDFSPAATDLSRIVNARVPYLVSSPIDVNEVVAPTSSYVAATDWWDASSILWAGNVFDGEANSPALAVSSLTEEGYESVLDCSPAVNRVPLFEGFDEIAVAPDGLMVLSGYQLWYLPVTVIEGQAYASCDAYFEDNVRVAVNVADFEVAPDGKTVALITGEYENDQPFATLGVGPVGETFERANAAWGAFDVGDPADYYTGLHWIADSQQLVWTSVQYTEDYEGGYNFTYLNDSAVTKINADGTRRRTLVYNEAPEGYLQSVVTTGPIGLPPSYNVGGN